MNEYLLFFSLFFPRLSLFFAWCYGAIPPNSIPFWFEFLLTLILPRALIIFYIGTTLGWNSGWIIAHAIAWMFAWVLSVVGSAKERS